MMLAIPGLRVALPPRTCRWRRCPPITRELLVETLHILVRDLRPSSDWRGRVLRCWGSTRMRARGATWGGRN